MAANLALASQCAVGVYPRRQIHTNSVTKSHNIITTANPLVKHSAGSPVVSVKPIHSNSVKTKRGGHIKMMSTHGSAVSTKVDIFNKTDEKITLSDYHYFDGEGAALPSVGPNQHEPFVHNATAGASVGAVSYDVLLGGKVQAKCVFAWSNKEGDDNLVYTVNYSPTERFSWSDVKKLMDQKGSKLAEANAYGCHSYIKLDDKESTAPTVTASVERYR